MNYSFSNMAAKLAARLIQAKPDTFNLPVVCGDYHLTHDQDRVEKFLINWLLPLCFRLGTGRYGMFIVSSFCHLPSAICHLSSVSMDRAATEPEKPKKIGTYEKIFPYLFKSTFFSVTRS